VTIKVENPRNFFPSDSIFRFLRHFFLHHGTGCQSKSRQFNTAAPRLATAGIQRRAVLS